MAALPAGVAGRDLAFPGQCGEYLGVRSQQDRAGGDMQLRRQPAQCRNKVVRDLRFMLSCARRRIKAPPWDWGEPAGEEHITPEISVDPPANNCLHFHYVIPLLAAGVG